MLEGELVLVEDTETLPKAGDAAAWRAGVPVGHCLENRSAHRNFNRPRERPKREPSSASRFQPARSAAWLRPLDHG